jgi:hypothetical protein
MALGVVYLGQQNSKALRVIAPVGPLGLLPEVGFISAIHADIMECILRNVKPLTVFIAVNKWGNLRTILGCYTQVIYANFYRDLKRQDK